jgi:hypothetical protein
MGHAHQFSKSAPRVINLTFSFSSTLTLGFTLFEVLNLLVKKKNLNLLVKLGNPLNGKAGKMLMNRFF